MSSNALPLSDVRVLDLGQAIAGPLCATFLADLGADVVKIERPTGDVYRIDRRDREGVTYNPPFEVYNRNKRSLCLDLKTDRGRDVLYELAEDADVFVQNWPPGVAERLGLDYETIEELNEDVVYVHVTGYGETGPDADKPALDAIIQHVTGYAGLHGHEGEAPLRSQASLVDYFTAYNAALSVLGALRARDAGGTGRKVDISMLHSMMHNMDGAFEYYNHLGEDLPRGGTNGFFEPDMLYGTAEAADGYLAVALILYSDRVWKGYCDILDRPDLFEAEKYQTDAGRMDDVAALTAEFEDWLADQTVEEALEVLDAANIPAAKHNTVAEAAELDQVDHLDVFTEVDHPKLGTVQMTDSPLSLGEDDASFREHAPLLGQDNEEILAEAGYTAQEIDDLAEDAVLVEE